MNANPISLPTPFTLAKTGTFKGKPALVAYDGAKETVLLVQNGKEWTKASHVPYAGIRGMNMLVKELDKGSVRNGDQTPIFAEDQQVETKPAKKSTGKPVPVAKEVVAKAEKPAKAIKAAPVAEIKAAPAAPVADAVLVKHFGEEKAAAIVQSNDIAFLRTEREEAQKAGAPAPVIRAITLRVGEVACGFSLATLRGPRAAAKVVTPRTNATGADPYALLVAAVAGKKEGERFTAEEVLGFGFPPSAAKHPTYWMSTGTPRAHLAQHGYAASLNRETGLLLRKL